MEKDGIIITVEVEIPSGDSCFYKSGHCCAYVIQHSGSNQMWCKLFDKEGEDIAEYRIVNCRKCDRCLALLERGKND
jgi:hypothetical protein